MRQQLIGTVAAFYERDAADKGSYQRCEYTLVLHGTKVESSLAPLRCTLLAPTSSSMKQERFSPQSVKALTFIREKPISRGLSSNLSRDRSSSTFLLHAM